MTRTMPETRFGTPSPGDSKLSPRYGDGRVCTEPQCSTVLSAYNPARTCWLHTPRAYGRSSAGSA